MMSCDISEVLILIWLLDAKSERRPSPAGVNINWHTKTQIVNNRSILTFWTLFHVQPTFRFINARRRIVQPMIDSSNRASKFFITVDYSLTARTNYKRLTLLKVSTSMAYQHHPEHMPGFGFPNSMDPRLPGKTKANLLVANLTSYND